LYINVIKTFVGSLTIATVWRMEPAIKKMEPAIGRMEPAIRKMVLASVGHDWLDNWSIDYRAKSLIIDW